MNQTTASLGVLSLFMILGLPSMAHADRPLFGKNGEYHCGNPVVSALKSSTTVGDTGWTVRPKLVGGSYPHGPTNWNDKVQAATHAKAVKLLIKKPKRGKGSKKSGGKSHGGSKRPLKPGTYLKCVPMLERNTKPVQAIVFAKAIGNAGLECSPPSTSHTTTFRCGRKQFTCPPAMRVKMRVGPAARSSDFASDSKTYVFNRPYYAGDGACGYRAKTINLSLVSKQQISAKHWRCKERNHNISKGFLKCERRPGPPPAVKKPKVKRPHTGKTPIRPKRR